ncbi:MAG: hypothetical protein KVP17_001764, partial [Porospora cf. gigantea B]|uniref:uncharacterized protein n=1 Tax=Porospora cf. gigantea B TaxID=2853592 RepID=UPI0035719D32
LPEGFVVDPETRNLTLVLRQDDAISQQSSKNSTEKTSEAEVKTGTLADFKPRNFNDVLNSSALMGPSIFSEVGSNLQVDKLRSEIAQLQGHLTQLHASVQSSKPVSEPALHGTVLHMLSDVSSRLERIEKDSTRRRCRKSRMLTSIASISRQPKPLLRNDTHVQLIDDTRHYQQKAMIAELRQKLTDQIVSRLQHQVLANRLQKILERRREENDVLLLTNECDKVSALHAAVGTYRKEACDLKTLALAAENTNRYLQSEVVVLRKEKEENETKYEGVLAREEAVRRRATDVETMRDLLQAQIHSLCRDEKNFLALTTASRHLTEQVAELKERLQAKEAEMAAVDSENARLKSLLSPSIRKCFANDPKDYDYFASTVLNSDAKSSKVESFNRHKYESRRSREPRRQASKTSEVKVLPIFGHTEYSPVPGDPVDGLVATFSNARTNKIIFTRVKRGVYLFGRLPVKMYKNGTALDVDFDNRTYSIEEFVALHEDKEFQALDNAESVEPRFMSNFTHPESPRNASMVAESRPDRPPHSLDTRPFDIGSAQTILDRWILDLPDQWILDLPDQWIRDLPDQWIPDLRDQWIPDLPDQWIQR